MLSTLRLVPTVVLALVATSMIGTAVRAEDEQPLIAVLQSDAPKAEKAITCKKLAVWGSEQAVPALAALLPDKELTSWARIALEAIPGPAADEALRTALGQLEGLPLVGVINSIGVRRDAQATDGLIQRLSDKDVAVASAAAVALGRIGNDPATAALRKTLQTAPEPLRSSVAEGCILCAEKMMANDQMKEAAELYDAVRAADLPKQRIVEATRGAILARGADGVELLVQQLQSSDKAMVGIGLSAARELRGAGASGKLVNALEQVAPDLQALLILALADRGDAETMPAMLEAVKSGPLAVRKAAIQVLKSLGDKSCLPTLLSAATEDDPSVAETAIATLKALPGDGVDADVVQRLAAAQGKQRLVLMQLVGLRRIDAVPPLLEAVQDADAEVRATALIALGEVAKLENLPVLITRVVNPPNETEGAVALEALRAACIRMPDRDACAEKLAAALPEASAGAREAILRTLTGMGGKKSLEILAQAAKSGDAQMQDTATQLLGTWMTVDAGPVLLDLATDPQSPHRIRALRAYIRFPRQLGVQLTDKQRVEMCRNAWEAAQRDAERKLVLEAVERNPSPGMLRLAVAFGQYPALKDTAAAVAISVAQKIGGGAEGAEKMLELAKGKPVKIEILKATYGANRRQMDVTAIVQECVSDLPVIMLPAPTYNAAFGRDPARNAPKQLTIQYRLDGKEGEAVFAENAPIVLPTPQ